MLNGGGADAGAAAAEIAGLRRELQASEAVAATQREELQSLEARRVLERSEEASRVHRATLAYEDERAGHPLGAGLGRQPLAGR